MSDGLHVISDLRVSFGVHLFLYRSGAFDV
jgi:hypothetical protein